MPTTFMPLMSLLRRVPASGSKCMPATLKHFRSWKKDHAHEQVSKLIESLDPHSSLCIKFAVKTLLTHESFHHLKPFCESMKELHQEIPGFLPPLAEALMTMGGSTLEEIAASEWDFLDLAQKTYLYKSALYQQFVRWRAEEKIHQHMSLQQSDEERCAFARKMLCGPLSEEQQKNLQFVQGFFGPLNTEEKIRFLFGTPEEHFEHLRGWAPNHDLLKLKIFASKGHDFLAEDPQKFLESAIVMCQSFELPALVVHPVAKSLLVLLFNSLKVAGDSRVLKPLAHGLFLELSTLKLSLPSHSLSLDPKAFATEDLQASWRNSCSFVSYPRCFAGVSLLHFRLWGHMLHATQLRMLCERWHALQAPPSRKPQAHRPTSFRKPRAISRLAKLSIRTRSPRPKSLVILPPKEKLFRLVT